MLHRKRVIIFIILNVRNKFFKIFEFGMKEVQLTPDSSNCMGPLKKIRSIESF